ncbi:hypothetical protein L3Q82_021729 [Scortum barcoo]|uniref:Uncharacterized protein n=1 Tax=Scortum barcoo TaxID=214431 RepID=A0ACB8X5A0_9TELE|nr:hypothetical protein L3Q82_021729 [Scortum barcoo]
MIVSNVSLSGCAGVSSALCAAAGEAQPGGGSRRTTLTPTGNLVVSVCLGFIGTFGLLNNLLVLVLFCRYKLLRSPINLLLINISFSDLLVCVLGTPFSFAASTQGRWLIGDAGCVWYGFANSLFGIVSLISLAVLSYERYSTMMAPTEADSSNYRKISLGIALSWAYSLIWTLPPLFGWSRYGPEGPGTTCSVDWTAKTANNISYIICLFVFCLIVPFLVIVFCYGKLLCAIKQLKKLDVLFVQETHSDSNNERDWRREWPGQVFLSHKQSNSAGAFSPQSVKLHHVMPGHALMVKGLYEKKPLRSERYATGFYRDLFKTELVEDPELDSAFLSDLPQVGDSSDYLLSAELTLDELHVALMSLANGKAPGIDGIPVDVL